MLRAESSNDSIRRRQSRWMAGFGGHDVPSELRAIGLESPAFDLAHSRIFLPRRRSEIQPLYLLDNMLELVSHQLRQAAARRQMHLGANVVTNAHTHDSLRMMAPVASPKRVGARAGNRRRTEQSKRQVTDRKIQRRKSAERRKMSRGEIDVKVGSRGAIVRECLSVSTRDGDPRSARRPRDFPVPAMREVRLRRASPPRLLARDAAR